ncbi:phage holin family protein [Myxococcus sp. Y35]|uniref:phage holin family protein n=1 Tax=Pseudomyxococcus flavus TaxID=3115648 RepID=UPI003CF7DB25
MADASEIRSGQASGGLLDKTLDVGRKLLRGEASRTGQVLRDEARDMSSSAALLGGAGLLAIGGVSALTLSLAKVLLAHPGRAALLGVGLVGGAAGLALVGLQCLPRHPLATVEEQVRRDLDKVDRALT